MSTLKNLTYDIAQIHLPDTKGDRTTTPIAETLVDPITQQQVKTKENKQVQINASPWGNAMPISIGARAVTGKIIWSSDLREVPQPEATDGNDTQRTPHYVVDLAVSFGKAIIDPFKRPGTLLANLWAQQKKCYSYADDEEAAAFNGIVVTFHPGLVDALPDATVVADKGDLTPAWRNQIYVVIKNFPLWLVGLSDGLPDFVAEIFDNVNGSPVTTNYTMKSPALTGSPHLLSQSPLMFDASRNVYYAMCDQNYLSTVDPVTLTEVKRVQVANPSSVFLNANDLCVHDAINGYALIVDGIFNDSPIHLVDLAAGKKLFTLGRVTASLADILNPDPTLVEVSFKITGDTIQVSTQGKIFYGAVLCGIFDSIAVIWYAYDGSKMQLTDKMLSGASGGPVGLNQPGNISATCAYPIIGRKDLSPVDGSSLVGNLQNTNPGFKQDAYCFVGHGSKVTLLRIGPDLIAGQPLTTEVQLHIREASDVADFPGGRIDGIFVDPVDYNLIVFWHPLDVAAQYMAKVQVQVAPYAANPDGTTSGHRPIVGPILYDVALPEGAQAFTNVQETYREAHPPWPWFGYFSTSGNFIEVDTSTGAVVYTTTLNRSEGFSYNGKLGTLEHVNPATGHIEHIDLRSAHGVPMDLSEIIAALMQSAGYVPSQFTVDSSVDDTALGAMLDRNADLWSTMQNISVAYDFQYYANGTGIVFKKPDLSAATPTFNVDIDALYPNQEQPYDAVTTTLASPDELPGNTAITYIDKEQLYVSNTQTFRRTNFPVTVVDSGNDTTVPVPIVMTAAEALRRSGMATFNQLIKSEAVSFKLPIAYLAAEPVDIIEVIDAGYSRSVLVGEIVIGADYCITVSGSNRNVRVNNRFRVGPDGNWITVGAPPFVTDPPKPPSKPPSTSPSDPVLLDIPLLTSAEAITNNFASLLCGAASKVRSGWTGATVSTEIGADAWSTLFHSIKSVPASRGVDVLPTTHYPFQTDNATVLTVEATNFDPALVTSVSGADFLAGKNAVLIGGPGRWELVYFRDVAVVDNTVQLTGLIRGARGTEAFVNSHDSSDVAIFVYLAGERQMVVAQGVSVDRLGDEFSVRARGDSFAGSISAAVQAIEAQSLKPWAPGEPLAKLGSLVNAVGTPSYSNTCGGGPFGGPNFTRTDFIVVTANTGGIGGVPENLVDGDFSSSTDHSFHIGSGLTGLVWSFDFRPSGAKQIITALTYDTQGGSPTGGTYAVDASNDLTTWTTLTTGIALSAGVEYSWANVTGYSFYRVRQVTGTTGDHVGHEFLFKTKSDVQPNDVIVRWKRRDRLHTGLYAFHVPLSEDVESYDLDIFKGGVKVRTVTGIAAPAYQYSEASQTTDGFAAPITNLDVTLFQNSVNVGRGFPNAVTLDVQG